MSEIQRLFGALRWEVFKIVFIDTVLNATILFFLCRFITSFFVVSGYWALGISLIYFFIKLFSKIKNLDLKTIEKRNPQIKEILRTANDNINSNNNVALALFEDLILKMRRISSGSMVNHNRVMGKLVIIFTIGIFSIILAANHFNIDGIELPTFEHYATVKQGGEFYGIEFNESTDIYGDSNVALLGNDEIEVTINPLLSNVKLSEVGELEEQEFEIHRFYGSVNAESDKISEEKAPAESELAIAYNLKIKEI